MITANVAHNAAHPSAILAGLFPSAVAAYELRGTADPTLLLPEEAAACGTFRAKRLEEFAAGRLCARGALGEFGLERFAVRRNPDRTPHWPEGIVGSITHTIGFCGAVAASRDSFVSLGIDAEIVSRVTPDVWLQTLTADDIMRISSLASTQRERAAAILFTAKEAFYKCQFRVTGAWLDYSDVSVEIVSEGSDSGTLLVRSATPVARRVMGDFVARGRYQIADALVFAGFAITSVDVTALAPLHIGTAS
jgi:4'-phosphopantetheinyl transferase EntD